MLIIINIWQNCYAKLPEGVNMFLKGNVTSSAVGCLSSSVLAFDESNNDLDSVDDSSPTYDGSSQDPAAGDLQVTKQFSAYTVYFNNL